jgi:hypothetical protein
MAKLPDPTDLRNPHLHLDLAAGLPGSFERLFRELPADATPPAAKLVEEDDGPHSDTCPCWRHDGTLLDSDGPDEDALYDMALDLADDRADSRWMS